MIFIDFRLPQTAQSSPKSMKIIGISMIFHNFKNFHEKKRYIKFENFFMAFFDHILALCRIWYCGMECTNTDGSNLTLPHLLMAGERHTKCRDTTWVGFWTWDAVGRVLDIHGKICCRDVAGVLPSESDSKSVRDRKV